MIGLTHEDVDANFSHITAALRKTDVETTDEFLKLLPNSDEIKYMHYVKGWLEKQLNPLKEHTQPLHFKRIQRCQNKLLGESEPEMERFKGHLKKKQQQGNTALLPKGQPDLVKEDFTKVDFERLLNLIRNV